MHAKTQGCLTAEEGEGMSMIDKAARALIDKTVADLEKMQPLDRWAPEEIVRAVLRSVRGIDLDDLHWSATDIVRWRSQIDAILAEKP
jgi:hypothetical protein